MKTNTMATVSCLQKQNKAVNTRTGKFLLFDLP